MEERIIDDEYGRGIRLKKTEDGYVDVTDELAPDTEDGAEGQETDEVSFEFPAFETDEDDEDLVGLSPEEAAALVQRKAEEAAARKEKYERMCAEGEELLAEKNFKAAELKYEQALNLDGLATVASVGYWRAKTANFTDPDALISEYANSGIESMEYDLGPEATDVIRREYKGAFKKRIAELEAEETPLAEAVEGKQGRRREVLAVRLRGSTLALIAALLPTVAAIILTVVFALKIPTTRDSMPFVVATAVCGAVSFVLFIISVAVLNKFLNALRMYRKNERLSSTEDGERLVEIRAYKELYKALTASPEENTEAEAAEAAESEEE